MEAAFGAGPPSTVGVEEEFQLVDPASRALAPAVGAVVEAGDGAALVTSELSRSCVEMVSPVFETVSDLARELPALRRRVAEMARGADTGLASTRIKIFEMFPRSGLPPAFGGWENFVRHVETLVASGSIPDASWCWWDARPHLKFGTVELRAPDVQTDASHTAALVALVQCLVANADGRAPEDPLFIAENKWRAVRRGMDATFYDFAGGRSVPARALARGLVEELRPVVQELSCEAELEGVLEIVERGTGAGRQRAAFEKSGSLEGLVDRLARATVSA